MFNPNGSKPTPSTTTTAPGGVGFKSAGAAVYRSLEVPLPPSTHLPLNFPSLGSAKPGFLGGVSTPQSLKGEVKWEASSASTQAPPPLGLYALSSNSIVLPNGHPKQGEVDEVLNKNNVEVTHRSPFEWACTLWTNFVETSFVVRQFGANVLDFQRECGCPFQFNQVVSAVAGELTGESSSSAKAASPKRPFAPLALPDEVRCSEEEGKKQCAQALLAMCASPMVDVQREGLLRLSHVLASGQCAKLTCPVPLLISLVGSSKDTSVRRLAVSALAASPTSPKFSEEELQVLLATLQNVHEVTETRREAVRVLIRAAEHHPELAARMKSIQESGATIICTDASLSLLLADLNRVVLQ